MPRLANAAEIRDAAKMSLEHEKQWAKSANARGASSGPAAISVLASLFYFYERPFYASPCASVAACAFAAFAGDAEFSGAVLHGSGFSF